MTQRMVEYVVLPMDTLSEIALRFGTTVEAIVARNKIANPDLIYPGQKLRFWTLAKLADQAGKGNT